MENMFNINHSKVWQEQLRNLYLYKLGLCKRCIFTATVGLVLSWTLFIILNIVFDNPLLLGLIGLVLIVSIGFSIVWLGHIVAYYFRVLIPLSEARRNLDVVRADLSISTIDSRHVAGTFKQGPWGLSFEAAINNEDLFLNVRDLLQERNLLMLKEKGRIIEISILDGRMTIRFPRLTLPDDISRKEITSAVENHLSEVSIYGEDDSFRDLQKLPDYELLPLLSKALGKAGITGDSFPAIVSLHLLAMGALSFRQEQRRNSDEGAGLNNGQPDVVYRIKHPYQNELLGLLDLLFVDDPCSTPFIDHIYMFAPGYEEPWMLCGSGSPCKDGKSRSYPNRSDNCYGMCGPGCDCWSLICGDCCYHTVCAAHDTLCRESGAKAQVMCWLGAPYRFTC